MAFNYDASQLSTSQLYQVRFTIGDTDSTDPLLQDEEINFVLSQKTTVLAASISCCESISAKYARMADYSLGPYSIKASQKAERYKQLAKELRVSNINANGLPLFTGPEENSSIFDIDMMNYASDSHAVSEEE